MKNHHPLRAQSLRLLPRQRHEDVLINNSIYSKTKATNKLYSTKNQSRTQSNACARARMALALGKLNFPCAVIGLTFINRACRQRTGTPKFRGSGCQFPQSQCHPSPRTGIALGTRLTKNGSNFVFCRCCCAVSSQTTVCIKKKV